MENILDQQTIDALSEIQANVKLLASKDYVVSSLNSTCGKGPTNCQNQW